MLREHINDIRIRWSPKERRGSGYDPVLFLETPEQARKLIKHLHQRTRQGPSGKKQGIDFGGRGNPFQGGNFVQEIFSMGTVNFPCPGGPGFARNQEIAIGLLTPYRLCLCGASASRFDTALTLSKSGMRSVCVSMAGKAAQPRVKPMPARCGGLEERRLRNWTKSAAKNLFSESRN